MKQITIWLFYISFFGVLFHGAAQQKNEIEFEEVLTTSDQDSIVKKKSPDLALRFGLDLYKPILSFASNDYTGAEIVGDLLVYNNFYVALEIGSEEKTMTSELINFTTGGTYFKLGFDYNMFENWVGMNNQVYVGLRYGQSLHKQKVNSYTLYTTHHYWPDIETTSDYATGERSGLSASWLEIVAGLKVQVFNNIYLGLSIRLHRLFNNESPNNFDNLYIPGFNKKTDENVFSAGFNYTLTYSIPFRFKKD